MAEYTTPATGRWTSSSNDEVWPAAEFFDTFEEAIAYARQEGDCYVGRVIKALYDANINEHSVTDDEDAQ